VKAPAQKAYEAFQATRWPLALRVAWTDPAVPPLTRAAWKAAIDAGTADVTRERDGLRAALREIGNALGKHDAGCATETETAGMIDAILSGAGDLLPPEDGQS
jgi:hypothetical protein